MNAVQFNTIVSLLKKRLQEPLSAEETVLLEQWLETSDENRQMLQKLDDPAVVAAELAIIAGAGESVFVKIEQQLPEETAPLAAPTETPPVHFLRSRFMKYAAAVVLMIGIGTWWWLSRDTAHEPQQLVSATKDSIIVPGSSGAILTLADGSQIVLDSIGNGKLTEQNGSELTMQNGRLKYDAAKESNTDMVYNTMTTPRGRQFEITLPDGTRVWLNAASSIRYPTAFTGNNRKVELDGEAYFEVKKNAKQPFIVNARNKAEIEVLGTDFNISAYENDKSLNTTLIDGSVKVNGVLIKPGQQAQVTDAVRVIGQAAIGKVTAWKRGLFTFEGTPLNEVMNQLERWYDIEVMYEKESPALRFGGELSRNMSLKGVLNALEQSGIHFRLEGRKLIVLPN